MSDYCTCDFPYLGAQPVGTPIRCERCSKPVAVSAQPESAPFTVSIGHGGLPMCTADAMRQPVVYGDMPESAAPAVPQGSAEEKLAQLVIDISREAYDRFVMGGWMPHDFHCELRMILEEYAATISEREAALQRELVQIDEAIARRPALADAPNRYTAVYRACEMAGRAESAEAKLRNSHHPLCSMRASEFGTGGCLCGPVFTTVEVSAEAKLQTVRETLEPTYVLLEALRVVTEWELAPSIKAEIARLAPQVAALLGQIEGEGK